MDAADAAAYSGATWVAQNLNVVAYANRAMIANHVGVGHFIAYVSYIRYVEFFTNIVALLTNLAPIPNPFIKAIVAFITNGVEEIADIVLQLAEQAGAEFVPSTDGLNAFYALVQEEVHSTLQGGNAPGPGGAGFDTPMDALMQATAERFDTAIIVNDAATISGIDPAMAVPLQAVLEGQNQRIGDFIGELDASDHDSRIARLVEHTYGVRDDPGGNMSREWLTDRQANLPLIGETVAGKVFETRHELGDDEAIWEAEDRFVLRTLLGFGPDIVFAVGRANTAEFDPDYEGIPQWYGLQDETTAHRVLPIVAYASKPQSESVTSDSFAVDPGGRVTSALSVAEVEHRRPDEGFESLIAGATSVLLNDDVDASDEYANLFNPFWRARIVGTHYSDLRAVDADVPLDEGLF